MNYEWIIENKGLDDLDFSKIEQIICKKLAHIIIKKEMESCV